MVVEWLNHMNGTTVFPKLHVYLHLHFTKWGHNQCVQDTGKNVRSGTASLEEVINFHTIPGQGPISNHTAIQGTVQGTTKVPTHPAPEVQAILPHEIVQRVTHIKNYRGKEGKTN
jgi:hypothetical protein